MNTQDLPALLCFSHLRWGFVFQRPQHLMSRLARRRRVFFLEEPMFDEHQPRLDSQTTAENVTVLVPHLPPTEAGEGAQFALRRLLDAWIEGEGLQEFVAWYYTPMALDFTGHLRPRVVVYDCMDELSGFAGAPTQMSTRETQLLARAHLVLTGGHSLYDAKRSRHANVRLFPSSVDAAHFGRARVPQPEPADQARIPSPRLGFAGVIDERMDLPLLAGLAAARPDWHIVMLGPVVKIDGATLPAAPNIHYLGMKTYPELPSYMASWSVGILPFAHNEATRFISPTKTPEYLAAGLPVVSTSIRDVVRTYGSQELAHFADTPTDFVRAVDLALTTDRARHVLRSDAFLSQMSWDQTVANMELLLQRAWTSRSVTQPSASVAF
jgi:glycosyltransferase involved in cell wall biosynthesis